MSLLQTSQPAGDIQFTGRGGEYFRIWIVNLALTILTLGIYSAWAKVRRLQYFYRNTTLYGNSFDYHGNPIAILKGRVIGVGLLIGYQAALKFSLPLGLTVFCLLIIALPWLLQKSISFKLINSSYRGLRFRFKGSMPGAYGVFLGWPILAYVSLGLLAPLAHREIKAYQHGNSQFGTSPFSFTAGPGKFYSVYLRMIGMALIPVVALGVFIAVSDLTSVIGDRSVRDPERTRNAFATLFICILLFYLALFLFVMPWFAARMQNLVWNHTALGPHTFSSNVRARDLLAIYVTNFIAIICTLGLFKPFADIRLARYRLTHMALQAQGNLDEFFAHEQQAVNAMGEETANVFDVDISF